MAYIMYSCTRVQIQRAKKGGGKYATQPKETSRYIGLVSRPPSLPRALLSSAFTERPAAGPTACQPASQPELSRGSLDPKFPIKKASQGQAGAIGGRSRRRRRREGRRGKNRKEGGGKNHLQSCGRE